jgi:hypothetical protein
MHVFNDRKVVLLEAVHPTERATFLLGAPQPLNLPEKDRALKAELDRQIGSGLKNRWDDKRKLMSDFVLRVTARSLKD